MSKKLTEAQLKALRAGYTAHKAGKVWKADAYAARVPKPTLDALKKAGYVLETSQKPTKENDWESRSFTLSLNALDEIKATYAALWDAEDKARAIEVATKQNAADEQQKRWQTALGMEGGNTIIKIHELRRGLKGWWLIISSYVKIEPEWNWDANTVRYAVYVNYQGGRNTNAADLDDLSRDVAYAKLVWERLEAGKYPTPDQVEASSQPEQA